MGLEAGGRGGAEEKEEEEKEEKIPHMCESIGHRPLRAPTLLPPQLQAQPTQAGYGYR